MTNYELIYCIDKTKKFFTIVKISYIQEKIYLTKIRFTKNNIIDKIIYDKKITCLSLSKRLEIKYKNSLIETINL